MNHINAASPSPSGRRLTQVSPRHFPQPIRLIAPLLFTTLLLQATLGASFSLGAEATPPPTASSPATAPSTQPAKPIHQVHGVQGMWVWRFESIETPDARKSLIGFAKRYGFNRLLVQIHFVHGSVDTGSPKLRDPEAYRALLIDAAAQGIRIEALDGGNDMALAANHPVAFSILDALLAFDSSLPPDARFAGIHYDIEPYLLPEWKTQRQDVMVEYLTFLTSVRAKLSAQSPRWTLAADIPFWYGHKTAEGDSCILTFNGKSKNFQDHIQDLTDYVGVMSYRRKAQGPNSISAIVNDSLEYAGKAGTGICPSMEVSQLKETPNITFFGTPPATFWEQKKLLETSLADRPGFSGTLVHSYERLREYLEPTNPDVPTTQK